MSISSLTDIAAIFRSRISRRSMLAGAGWFAVGTAGCETQREMKTAFQVAGPSMAPTLWGPSVQFSCAACKVPIRVDAEHWKTVRQRVAAVRERGASPPRCWHCGTPVDGDSIAQPTRIEPDVVTVVSPSLARMQQRLDTGDKPLVLLKHEDGIHVKRILAGPGQVVTADESGRLLVDAAPVALSDSPRLPIDIDEQRTGDIPSRWICVDDAWQRDQEGIWSGASLGTKSKSGLVWLVYQHRNVYRGNVVSRVLDDCPANLGIDRRLHPVDDIGLAISIQPQAGVDVGKNQSRSDRRVHVISWTEQGPRVVSQTLPEQPSKIGSLIEVGPTSFRKGSELDASGLNSEGIPELSSKSPIAVGLDPRSVANARDLCLWRSIVWRAPQLSRWELGTDEWFAAGDNVPVSVDSRSWGPIRANQIVGVCEPLTQES
ncbi:S26 family signal peptidase [Rhodopirellula bahusiensis]|uniref:S26 family signal peptidase n=2 Tax=Rhodopirellula bahusiensis TaxID=2014065 RepID=UPI003267B5B8